MAAGASAWKRRESFSYKIGKHGRTHEREQCHARRRGFCLSSPHCCSRHTPDRPGHVLGRLALRTHVAVVDIDYTDRTYSIRYKDSTNLDYNGTTIHRNYNGWIENLDKAIKAQLTAL